MKRALTIFIGFAHDFTAGLWVATVLSVWWLHRRMGSADLDAVLKPLMQQFFYLGLASTATVLLAGVGRTFTYVDKVYGADAEAVRRRMLIIKHVALLLIFGAGTWAQVAMIYG